MKSPSTPYELSIIDNSILTSEKRQPSKIPTPATPKLATYKAKEASRKHLFSYNLYLQGEIIFLRKELGNKQRIIETLLQQVSENIRLIHQVEATTFNNDSNKNVNIKSSKNEPSK